MSKNLKLFRLVQTCVAAPDEMQAIVLFAPNELQARNLANNHHKKEGPIWFEEEVTCAEITIPENPHLPEHWLIVLAQVKD